MRYLHIVLLYAFLISTKQLPKRKISEYNNFKLVYFLHTYLDNCTRCYWVFPDYQDGLRETVIFKLFICTKVWGMCVHDLHVRTGLLLSALWRLIANLFLFIGVYRFWNADVILYPNWYTPFLFLAHCP